MPVHFKAPSSSLSRSCNQFLQSIQIQPSRYQLITHNEAGCPRDAEFAGEGAILVNDGLPLGIDLVSFKAFRVNEITVAGLFVTGSYTKQRS